MARLTKLKILEIQHGVLDWYAINKRDLPWRHTSGPFAILVSEIMLQQTQVSRVIPKYKAFLIEFPTVYSLATATPAAVIRAWKGLGYNRRALNLQRAAQVIADQYHGEFPSSFDDLIKLPGIGRYTAGAVATFAFGAIEPAVDTNVRQFIDALVPTRRIRTENDYYTIAAMLIPADQPSVWLHAVMDYASVVLRTQSKTKRITSKKPAELFIGSNRYLRGQIIDRLRLGPHVYSELMEQIAEPIAVSSDRFLSLLQGLEKDGLIVNSDNYYRLVGDK